MARAFRCVVMGTLLAPFGPDRWRGEALACLESSAILTRMEGGRNPGRKARAAGHCRAFAPRYCCWGDSGSPVWLTSRLRGCAGGLRLSAPLVAWPVVALGVAAAGASGACAVI